LHQIILALFYIFIKQLSNLHLFIMRKHLFIYLFILLSMPILAQSGIVFRDGNGNGTKETGERGMPGIIIKSYINNGIGDSPLGNATTDFFGQYSLSPAAAAGQKVRIEFELPSGCVVNNTIDFEAQKGANFGSAVQFVSGPQSNINFAIYNPLTEFLQDDNPIMYSVVYSAGNPSHPSVEQSDAVLGFRYQYEGIPGDTGRPAPILVAVTKDLGTTWGIAHSKYANKLFVSSFMKRHAGLGPLGSGGVYMIDLTKAPNTNVTNFFSFDTDLNIPTSGTGTYIAKHPGFSDVIGTNTERKLKGITDLTRDGAAFGQVGKVSLGGIELSEDGRYLFIINLYDRKLYRIDLKDAKNPQKPTAADVKSYDVAPWLTLNCDNGVARPFALKYHRGKIYVGITCTGENLGKSVAQYSAPANEQVISSKVYEIDPSGTGVGTAVLDIPLNYGKNLASKFDNGVIRGWYNWTDDISQITYSHGSGQDSTWSHPQPMLCDIEFDVEGSMITSFFDRTGHQMGWRNYRPTPDSINRLSYTASGEILRAWKNPNSCDFELENNGTAGPYSTAGKDKSVILGAYPGTGEFYFGDDAYTLNKTQPWHGESVIGGLAVCPSSGEVVAGAFDALDGRTGKPYSGIANGLRASFSGGPIRLNNITGDKISGYSLYTATGFGKAAGIGDMELTGQFAPIAVGNRVWDDADSDGIQDADEIGFDNVKLELYKGNLKIGEAITANDGQWYFDSTNVVLNGVNGFQPQTDYEIRVDTVLFFNVGQSILTNYFLTKKEQNGQGLAGVSDSDASYKDGVIVVPFKTGDLGYTNYNLDIGLTQNPPCSFVTAGLDSVICNNNTTLADTTDDFMSFTLNPSGINMWVTYDVAVNQGTISPTSANIGEITKFQLQAGSAGGGDVVVTLFNSIDPTCSIDITILDTGNCNYTCPDSTYDICPGDVFRIEIENNTFTQVQWYVNQGFGPQPIVGANGITYDVTAPGIYTYSALDGSGCNAGSCCPTTFKLGPNCCKPKICAPVKIIKK
jgi:SdrD B-like domain